MDLMPGANFDEVWKALSGAFDQNTLTNMMRVGLGKRLDHYTGAGTFTQMTFELLQRAEMEGWHVELIQAAHRFNSGNAALTLVHAKYGLSPSISVQDAGVVVDGDSAPTTIAGFEKTVKPHNPMVHYDDFHRKMEEASNWVCSIELDGVGLGTGFLIATDLVMTNYHVMESIVENREYAKKIGCRFGYRRLSNGATLEGVLVGLADEWDVCATKYSDAERDGQPEAKLPMENELDFSVIRLSEEIGSRPIGPSASGAPPRGWCKFPQSLPITTPPLPIIIVQHPNGEPLQIAFETHGIKQINANATRVRYDTTTARGSSGSPCFSFDWVPVALHHYGDPTSGLAKADYNQGIPFTAIREYLNNNGHEGLI